MTATSKNRWIIAFSAIAIHMSIGSIYAYSVYQNPLQELHGWTNSQVTLAFSLGLFFLGITAASMGWFVNRYGPRLSGYVSAVVFGIGTVGAGIGVELGSLPIFLFMFGVLGGVGLGIGYIAPVSTLVSWFPDKRGLATGLAVFGFGGGALITAPVAEHLMSIISVSQTFYTLGVFYFIAITAGASYLAKPPEGWTPEGFDQDVETEGEHGPAGATASDLAQLTGREALRTPRFYLLWVVMFLNIAAGLMVLSQASNMTQEITGVTAAVAAGVVGVIGFFNAGGRIGWSALSDYTGRTNMFTLFFAAQILIFLLMPSVTNVYLFAAMLCLVVSFMGGGFACLPAYIGDLFGTRSLAVIHGYLLTAWALAGLASPQMIAYFRDTTGSFAGGMYVIAGGMFVGLIAITVLRLRINNVRDADTVQTPAAES
ncbi:OFA family MFS transporter [Salinarchaeum sp. IM2453]|uniref:L-lactate MFS transporter n=1 Tax=Salinarchaeum sp. IM2453 TaxID=2862870 RepID=UPI001C82C26B|nr:OFA family MFS transporter [Salinarchaeum sp. IM2453]QZA88045.1 OFA family MFS transporter [Salinarchaeum sp. IM2453]